MLDVMRDEFARRFSSPDRDTTYETPNLPLDVEVFGEDEGLRVPYEDLEMLKACVRWEIDPPFYSDGRTSFIPRNDDLDVGGIPVKAYKIKGLGACGQGKAHPPRDEQFFQRTVGGGGAEADFMSRMQVLIHTGVNPDGSFRPIVDPPKPIGGMKFSRAENEFKNAQTLMDNGVPAIMPVAYGKYNNLNWDGEPMGFVVLALPIRDHFRVSEMFEPQRSEMGENVGLSPYLMSFLERRFDFIRPDRPGFPVAKFVYDVEKSCGGLLRGFNNSGLCRFAGHTGNYSYDLGARTAILHDLDSSVQIDSLAPAARGLSIVRDLESSIFGFIHSFLHSEMHKVCSKDILKDNNPFEGFLIGYFGDNKSVRKTASVILSRLRREIQSMPMYGSMEFMQWFGEFGDRWTYQLMELMMPLFMESELGQQYPLPYGPGEIFKGHYEKLRGERFRVQQEELARRAQQMGGGIPMDTVSLIREMLRRSR